MQLFTSESGLLLAILYKGRLIYNIISPVYTARLNVQTAKYGDMVSLGIGPGGSIEDYCLELRENNIIFRHCVDEQYNVTFNL